VEEEMRINVDDETVDEIVKNWLVMMSTQMKNHDDREMRDIAEASRNLLELNWPHLYD
jgi:hypothetical protein